MESSKFKYNITDYYRYLVNQTSKYLKIKWKDKALEGMFCMQNKKRCFKCRDFVYLEKNKFTGKYDIVL